MKFLRNKSSKEIIKEFENLHSAIVYVTENNLSWDDLETVDEIDLAFEKEEGNQAIYSAYSIDEV